MLPLRELLFFIHDFIMAEAAILRNGRVSVYIYSMKERIPQEAAKEHVGTGESPEALEERIKVLGKEIARLSDKAVFAAGTRGKDRAASLEKEKRALLDEQQELLRELAGLREQEGS